jgi:hypothetical protein
MRTRTINNSRTPTWDEEFDVVVDDPVSPTL